MKSTASATSATGKPGRVGVAVDGDDAKPVLPRLQDRAALVAPRADEEDGLHVPGDASARAVPSWSACHVGLCASAGPAVARADYGHATANQQERDAVPARELTAVATREARPDVDAGDGAGHERLLGPAVDLRARGSRAASAPRARGPAASSRRQASAGRATVPLAGLQRSVSTRVAAVGLARTEMRRLVAPGAPKALPANSERQGDGGHAPA